MTYKKACEKLLLLGLYHNYAKIDLCDSYLGDTKNWNFKHLKIRRAQLGLGFGLKFFIFWGLVKTFLLFWV